MKTNPLSPSSRCGCGLCASPAVCVLAARAAGLPGVEFRPVCGACGRCGVAFWPFGVRCLRLRCRGCGHCRRLSVFSRALVGSRVLAALSSVEAGNFAAPGSFRSS